LFFLKQRVLSSAYLFGGCQRVLSVYFKGTGVQSIVLVGHRDALSSWPTYDSRPRCVCAYACPFIIDFYKSTHEDEKSCTELSEINSGYDAAVTRPRRVKHARDDHAGRAAVRGRHSQAPSPRLNLRSRYAPSSTGRNNTATHFAFAARHSTMA